MLSTSCNSPFIPHSPPHDVPKDRRWWYHILEQPSLSQVTPGPIILDDFEAYSDASSGIGIGITIADRWRAWRLIPGWKADGRDIGWAEALGFELVIQSLCQVVRETHNSHFKVYGDNKGVVEGWWNGRSRNKPTNHIFKRIHQFTKIQQVVIHSRYVASKYNPSDNPSRGVYGPHSHLLPHIPIHAELRPFIVDFDAKLHPAELKARDSRRVFPAPAKPARPHSHQQYQSFNIRQEHEEELIYLSTL
jgi:hypothetical protein